MQLNNSTKKRKVDFFHHGNGEAKTEDDFKKPKLSAQGLSQDEMEKIRKQRLDLPIYEAKNRFLQEVKKSDSIILVGETGSGKTTQIPQFLFEAQLNYAENLVTEARPNLNSTNSIAITQPRRVAAISLAKRVADEMISSGTVKENQASLVGHKVRFDDSTTEDTRITFQTDGMLLREAMIDPLLSRYSWILLDEAHERNVNTDILFGVVKNAQRKRFINYENRIKGKSETSSPSKKPRFLCEAPLKVIVMSATLDALKFSAYFINAPILVVRGRQHPVNIYHVSQSQDDWQTSILNTIFQIHREAPPQEDILVFLTGQEEIESMTHYIRQVVSQEKSIASDNSTVKLVPLPLYASLQPFSQQKVFMASKQGTRKVILSTNIAETSITIPGIRFVIDSCRVKAKVHIGSIGLDMLQVVKISQAQGQQRAGRAGRQREGDCYRMLTKPEFDRLPNDTVPEIKRTNLCSVLLQMLSIGIRSVSTFDFLEPPPQDAIKSGVRLLNLLGAIQEQDNTSAANGALSNGIASKLTLTPLGKKMSAFPLDPKFTKAILIANDLGCTEEIITIVSLLYGDQSILLTPTTKREEAVAARKRFVSSEGDLVTLLKIFRAYKEAKNKEEFCSSNFIHRRNIQFAVEVRKQLMKICESLSIPIQSCAGHTELARKALAQGMFTNVARLTRDGHYVTLDSSQEVKIHPSSVMFGYKPELVMYCNLMATQKSYIRNLSLVDQSWLIEAQPDYFRKHRIAVGEAS